MRKGLGVRNGERMKGEQEVGMGRERSERGGVMKSKGGMEE